MNIVKLKYRIISYQEFARTCYEKSVVCIARGELDYARDCQFQSKLYSKQALSGLQELVSHGHTGEEPLIDIIGRYMYLINNRIGVMQGVVEYCEKDPVELWVNETGRFVIKATNECGNNCTDIDFLSLIDWMNSKEGREVLNFIRRGTK